MTLARRAHFHVWDGGRMYSEAHSSRKLAVKHAKAKGWGSVEVVECYRLPVDCDRRAHEVAEQNSLASLLSEPARWGVARVDASRLGFGR